MLGGSLEQLVEPRVGARGEVELAEGVAAGVGPVCAGDQEPLGVGVAAAAWTQISPARSAPRSSERRQSSQWWRSSLGRVDVGAPAARDEPDWRVVRDPPSTTAVQVAQHVHRSEKRLACGVRMQRTRLEHPGRELTRRPVAFAELLEMAVLEWPLDRRGKVERELGLFRCCALPHRLTNLRVGNLRAEEYLEPLAEEHDRRVRAVCDVEQRWTSARPALACCTPTPSSKRSTISSVTRAAASAQNASSAGCRNAGLRRPTAWLVA